MYKKNEKKPDGKKAHFENTMYKVGRVRYNSWATQVLKACDIVIYERELVHIRTYHGIDLEKIGFTTLDFVKIIIEKFNCIYKGSGNSFLLVMEKEPLSNVAAIELTINKNQKDTYKINTALSIETKRLHKKKLLCANPAV